ncbi:unnamed protein product [Mytilus coruscus]|uniref:Uncharacterized protein n=1 Tax=Mytilus coruscus TaxID=42192 RepID=A0A6J8AAA4_MYTCO|nr:unnamed protein product [Mytilus coruscus]
MRDCPSIKVNVRVGHFDKDAVKGLFSIGSEFWVVLVWSFTIVPGATFQGRPDHSNALDLPGMPVRNLDQTLECSCLVGGSIFVPNKNIAILTSELSLNDSGNESDQDDQGISDHNSAEDEHYTSIFQIKSSTYGEQYQQNLKEVQGALRQCNSVPVRLLFEEDNPKDKNAICVNVTVNSKDLKLYYIGVKKKYQR